MPTHPHRGSLEQIKLSVSDFPSFIAFSRRGYLQTRCDNFRARCVSHSSDAWNRLTSDQEILSTVFGTTIEFDSPPCQHYLPQSVGSDFDTQVIDLEITKLLSKNFQGKLCLRLVTNSKPPGPESTSHP